MRDEKSNYTSFILFFLLIVFIVIIGSFTIYKMKYNELSQKKVMDNKIIISDKLKKNKDKDFVFYKDKELLSEELNILYTYPIINLDSTSANEINNILKANADSVKNSIVKDICENNQENIKSAINIDYNNYLYQEYLSILVNKNNYECNNNYNLSEINSYTFNVLTGKLITYEELLNKYNYTYTKVLDLIKSNLESDNSEIDIDNTINNLRENKTYNIYIDEVGKLAIKYIVKTNGLDYNDIIRLN